MSDKKYYLCEFHLDGRRLYVVWYSNDDDGLLGAHDGKIASSTELDRLRTFCSTNGLTLMPDAPARYDFDSVCAWCKHPVAEAVEPELFLNVWNMLGDSRSLHEADVLFADDAAAGRSDKVYEKLLYANNLPSLTPEGARYEPIWSAEELSLLSRIYAAGLGALRARIAAVD